MTDHFAVLDQPRLPWLDPDTLKQAFHAKSLRSHPDVHTANAEPSNAPFTELNEAYRVLQDPKRRVYHLLELEGDEPGIRITAVPKQIEKLFPRVAELTHKAQTLREQVANTTSSLSRALLEPQLVEVQQKLGDMLRSLHDLEAQSVSELQQLTVHWENDREATLPALQQLYLRFSYLTRWITELEEKQMQLAGL